MTHLPLPCNPLIVSSTLKSRSWHLALTWVLHQLGVSYIIQTMHSSKEQGRNHELLHPQATYTKDSLGLFPYCRKWSDPLVHVGRNFGWTIFSFCSICMLITNGLAWLAEDLDPTSLTLKYLTANPMRKISNTVPREWQEDHIFQALLKMCHGLEDRLADAELKEVQLISDLVGSTELLPNIFTSIQKGANASCANDTKGMKGAVINWITPSDHDLAPSLHHKHRFDRGVQHEATGALLCPARVNWSSTQWVTVPTPNWTILNYLWNVESRKSWRPEKCMFEVTSSWSLYMKTAVLTLRTHGRGSYAAKYWS